MTCKFNNKRNGIIDCQSGEYKFSVEDFCIESESVVNPNLQLYSCCHLISCLQLASYSVALAMHLLCCIMSCGCAVNG